MSLKKYIIGMIFATIFCWMAWGLILFYLDPAAAGLIGIVCFHFSLLFALIGSFTIIGLCFRIFLSHNEVLFAHVSVSFRQGVLLSIVLVGSLIMQQFRILNWWDGSLFAVSIGLLEFYFMSRNYGY